MKALGDWTLLEAICDTKKDFEAPLQRTGGWTDGRTLCLSLSLSLRALIYTLQYTFICAALTSDETFLPFVISIFFSKCLDPFICDLFLFFICDQIRVEKGFLETN